MIRLWHENRREREVKRISRGLGSEARWAPGSGGDVGYDLGPSIEAGNITAWVGNGIV